MGEKARIPFTLFGNCSHLKSVGSSRNHPTILIKHLIFNHQFGNAYTPLEIGKEEKSYTTPWLCGDVTAQWFVIPIRNMSATGNIPKRVNSATIIHSFWGI